MFSDTIKMSMEIINELIDMEIDKLSITNVISVITKDTKYYNIDLENITYPVNTDDTFKIELMKNSNDNIDYLIITVGPRDWSFDTKTGECTGSGMQLRKSTDY